MYYVVIAAAGGVVYLRLIRGWRLADMMYVTRASLKSSVGQLHDGAPPAATHLSVSAHRTFCAPFPDTCSVLRAVEAVFVIELGRR